MLWSLSNRLPGTTIGELVTRRFVPRIAVFTACIVLALAFALPATASAEGYSALTLMKTSAVKDTKSLVTYPGHKSKLKVALYGNRTLDLTWKSSNPKVAKVNQKGTVRGKKIGRCYITASNEYGSVKVLVEVTSAKAYQAVRNGFADMQTKIVYSQAKRMQKYYRDCSSFVSRCYWDPKLGRKLFVIGDSWAQTWALPAADQAKWLNSKGKRVSWKACSVKKLRPGDTLYFETDYAGKDKTQWRYIDHAALYVGNGYVLDTDGSGGKGEIGYRWRKYYQGDKKIKFIGRPCP